MVFIAALFFLVSMPLVTPASADHYKDCEASSTPVYCRAYLSRGSADPTVLKVRGVMSSFRKGDLVMKGYVYENGNLIWTDVLGTCLNATSCDRTRYPPLCKNGATYNVYITFKSYQGVNHHPCSRPTTTTPLL
jgi:hypothetical protein